MAEHAARSTTPLLRDAAANRRGAARFEGRDVKLGEDTASEALIRATLAEKSDLPVLGEEAGWEGEDRSAGLHWVVDPLDGSFNYDRGIPLYCVAIALCQGRQPLLGVIHDPTRGETFSGGPGLPLRLNGQPLVPPLPQRRLLATGIPSRADLDQAIGRLAEQARRWTKLRLLGSAGLSLAWTAAGRLDGYAEDGIMWWDVAAGLALARAAGLPVSVVARAGHAVSVAVGQAVEGQTC